MNSCVSLQVDLGGLIMKNPVTVASGTFGSGREYAKLWSASAVQDTASSCPETSLHPLTPRPNLKAFPEEKLGKGAPPLSMLGALTTKGVSLAPWPGNTGTRVTETASGMLNSIGLQNPGVHAFMAEDLAWLAAQGVPVIVNVSGRRAEEYAEVISCLETDATVRAYEVNISCPNVDCGGMSFGTDTQAAAQVVSKCRAATKRPLIVKLTPNTTDITEIARAAEAAGASALSMINTVAGMAIDLKTRSTVFARGVGGLSGPAIKPVALYAIYRVFKAVKVPILGMGGIRTATDALEFMLAGASAVAVGTAHFADPFAAVRLIADLKMWCKQEGVQDIRELVGALR